MKMVGLNPMEQEIIDLTNEIAKNGLIYFPEFCNIVHRRFRADDEEAFRQNMFKVNMQGKQALFGNKTLNPLQMLCGTDPLPELYRAKKYKKSTFRTIYKLYIVEKRLRFLFFFYNCSEQKDSVCCPLLLRFSKPQYFYNR